MSQIIIITFLFVAFIFLLRYHWQRRQIYKLASKLPGPVALPLIGNALKFLCPPEDMLTVITNIASAYSKPLRFWMGQNLVIYFSYPQHIEKILSSSKLAYKHDFYNLVKIYLGDGLVSNSGEKYKKHRRLIQPLINLKFVSSNIDVFQRHITILLDKLQLRVDTGKIFDIHDYIHECFADIVGESLLGTHINAQYGKNKDFIQAIMDMYNVGYKRLIKPWHHPDFIYNLTQGKKDQNRIVHVTTKFMKDVISKTWTKIKSEKDSTTDTSISIIDQIANIIKTDPKCINDRDFLYHMITLYAASEDTMTVITSVLCVCLGMYPEYQKIAANEIRSVFGETPREVNYEDVVKLQYLDMCIRDVLRLIPIAPIILRKTIEDFQIDNYTIPKGCGILVSIFDVHRDPTHWENPEHFHPDHFLPEVVRTRHPFAYVPFSAGPRSCIGKVLALTGMKVIMARILQRFKIQADGKFPDVALKTDITVRLRNGYNLRLKNRI